MQPTNVLGSSADASNCHTRAVLSHDDDTSRLPSATESEQTVSVWPRKEVRHSPVDGSLLRGAKKCSSRRRNKRDGAAGRRRDASASACAKQPEPPIRPMYVHVVPRSRQTGTRGVAPIYTIRPTSSTTMTGKNVPDANALIRRPGCKQRPAVARQQRQRHHKVVVPAEESRRLHGHGTIGLRLPYAHGSIAGASREAAARQRHHRPHVRRVAAKLRPQPVRHQAGGARGGRRHDKADEQTAAARGSCQSGRGREANG